MSEDKNFLNLNHARSQEQIDLMKKIIADGVCPFCPEYLTKYHPKGIIHENENWFLTENMTPYEGSKFHFLAIYKKHAIMPSEVPAEHIGKLFELLNWAIEAYKIPGGSILMRFGDTDYTGASVTHLHAHLVVGDSRQNSDEKLKTKIGYKIKS